MALVKPSATFLRTFGIRYPHKRPHKRLFFQPICQSSFSTTSQLLRRKQYPPRRKQELHEQHEDIRFMRPNDWRETLSITQEWNALNARASAHGYSDENIDKMDEFLLKYVYHITAFLVGCAGLFVWAVYNVVAVGWSKIPVNTNLETQEPYLEEAQEDI